MVFIIFLVLFILLGFKIINKNRELNIEKILHKGNLKHEQIIKGDVFYKSMTKDAEDNLCYYLYIRLEDGKEIIINHEKFYPFLNIGDVVSFNKEIYIYKSYKLTFYSLLLEGLEEVRLCEEVDFIN